MADTGTAPAPMTAEERAKDLTDYLFRLGKHSDVKVEFHPVEYVAGTLRAAEQEAELRGAERERVTVWHCGGEPKDEPTCCQQAKAEEREAIALLVERAGREMWSTGHSQEHENLAARIRARAKQQKPS